MSEVSVEWADGAHPPKGVSAEAFLARLRSLPQPSPECSFEASKDPNDLLHDATWGEGDQVWANRARLDYHRHIISTVCEVVVVGGKNIKVRAVEFIHKGENDDGRWINIGDIRDDAELMEAYMGEIQRLQEQASGKMAKFRELIRVA